MSEGSGACLLDAVSSRAWRAQVRKRSNSIVVTGAASSNACSKGSAARAARPSAPNNAAFGNRAGHDPLARRTQLAILWLSMIRLSAGRQSSYGVPHGSVMAVVSAARICESLIENLCVRSAVGEGCFGRPRRRTLERARYQLQLLPGTCRVTEESSPGRREFRRIRARWTKRGEGLPPPHRAARGCLTRCPGCGAPRHNRPNLDGPAQTVDGFVMPPLGRCKYTQIEMDFGVAWIDGQRALVALELLRRCDPGCRVHLPSPRTHLQSQA